MVKYKNKDTHLPSVFWHFVVKHKSNDNNDTSVELKIFYAFYFLLSDSAVQSNEKDSEGHPLLQLSPPTVHVRCFSQLSKLVHVADDKKLEEVRACLEGKRDEI